MTKTEALTELGLSKKYTLEEVKKRYRVEAKKYHPDIVGDKFAMKFARLTEAYDFLIKLGVTKGCILTHKNIFDIGIGE